MVAQQNQINLGKENCIPLQGMVSCLPSYITPRSIWDRCPFSWYNSKIVLWMYVDVGRKWGIVKYRKRYEMRLSAQLSCGGIEYRFKLKHSVIDWKKTGINSSSFDLFSLFRCQWAMATGLQRTVGIANKTISPPTKLDIPQVSVQGHNKLDYFKTG